MFGKNFCWNFSGYKTFVSSISKARMSWEAFILVSALCWKCHKILRDCRSCRALWKLSRSNAAICIRSSSRIDESLSGLQAANAHLPRSNPLRRWSMRIHRFGARWSPIFVYLVALGKCHQISRETCVISIRYRHVKCTK